MHYPDLSTTLLSAKRTGANAVGERARSELSGPRAECAVPAGCERFRTPQDLPASHDLFFACTRK